MLNTIPLPTAPSTMPGQPSKTDQTSQLTGKDFEIETENSFASTLEAVNNEKCPTAKDCLTETENQEESTQAMTKDNVDAETGLPEGSIENSAEGVIPEQSIPFVEIKPKSTSDRENTDNQDILENESTGFNHFFRGKGKPTTQVAMKAIEQPMEHKEGQSEAGFPALKAAHLDLQRDRPTNDLKIPMEQGDKPISGDPLLQMNQVMGERKNLKIAPKEEYAGIDGTGEAADEIGDDPEIMMRDTRVSTSQLKTLDKSNRPPEISTSDSKKVPMETVNQDKINLDDGLGDERQIRPQSTERAGEHQKIVRETAHETTTLKINEENNGVSGRQILTDPSLQPTNASLGEKPAMVFTSNTGTATSALTEPIAQETFQQLVERAIITVKGEQSEARIALKPEHLGQVQMKIVTENSLVNIRIIADSSITRDLIEANTNQLKTELQQQGLNVESIEVSVSEDDRDAHRDARQRAALLRHMSSRAQSKPDEEDGLPKPYDASANNETRREAVGIDYFA